MVSLDTELSPRPEWIPARDHLSCDERQLYARTMWRFRRRPFLCRLSDRWPSESLVGTGDFANTLILLASDNGASAEGGLAGAFDESRWLLGFPGALEENLSRLDQFGGPKSFNHYPVAGLWQVTPHSEASSGTCSRAGRGCR